MIFVSKISKGGTDIQKNKHKQQKCKISSVENVSHFPCGLMYNKRIFIYHIDIRKIVQIKPNTD